jgi:monodechloroaminopyrrolnitrin synthase
VGVEDRYTCIRKTVYNNIYWGIYQKMVYVKAMTKGGMDGQSFQLLQRLQWEREVNKAIADADPLQVDSSLHMLPILNEQQNSEMIRKDLAQAVARVQDQIKGDFIRASAAIRDLCMFAASLIRYDIEPSECVPGFSDALVDLSNAVKSSLPRDSFIDYTARNPVGERERHFTCRSEEGIFIDSLRRGMAALDSSLQEIMQANYYSFAQQGFAEHCDASAHNFQIMIDAIVQVKRGITTEVFTHSIRPFFEPFTVEGKAYSAPSGAEMSILNIDMIIWGSDCKDELYAPYVQANIIRLPVVYQEICQLSVGHQSLMTRIKELTSSGRELRHDERNSIRALLSLLTKMYSFRMPHYKVAEDNVKLRLKETGGGEVKGSSGFGIDEVKYVLDQTMKSRQVLSQILLQDQASSTSSCNLRV